MWVGWAKHGPAYYCRQGGGACSGYVVFKTGWYREFSELVKLSLLVKGSGRRARVWVSVCTMEVVEMNGQFKRAQLGIVDGGRR